MYNAASTIVSLIRGLEDFCFIMTALKKKFIEVIYFNFAIYLFAIMIIQLFYARYSLFLLLSFLSVGNKWHYITYDSTKWWQQLDITDCRLTFVFSSRSRTNAAYSIKIYLHPVKKVVMFSVEMFCMIKGLQMHSDGVGMNRKTVCFAE